MPDITEIHSIANKISRWAASVQSLITRISALPEESFNDIDAIRLQIELEFAADRLRALQEMTAYMSSPVVETSRLWKNGRGQYESTKGHCFYAGNDIEVLVPVNGNTDAYQWVRTRLQHDGKDYYLAEYPDLPLVGLGVRVRVADKP